MGNSISWVRGEVRKVGQEAEDNANDALAALEELARAKTALFMTTMKDKTDTTRIQVRKFMKEATITKCSVKFDGNSVAKHISSTYESFVDNQFARVIGGILSTTLNTLLGSEAVSSNDATQYFIVVGSLGYLCRIDMNMYAYRFKGQALANTAKNFVCVSVIISSVDDSDLQESDIGALVQACYKNEDVKVQRSMLQKVLGVWKRGKTERSGGARGGDTSDEEEDIGFGEPLNIDDVQTLDNVWREAMEKEALSPLH